MAPHARNAYHDPPHEETLATDSVLYALRCRVPRGAVGNAAELDQLVNNVYTLFPAHAATLQFVTATQFMPAGPTSYAAVVAPRILVDNHSAGSPTVQAPSVTFADGTSPNGRSARQHNNPPTPDEAPLLLLARGTAFLPGDFYNYSFYQFADDDRGARFDARYRALRQRVEELVQERLMRAVVVGNGGVSAGMGGSGWGVTQGVLRAGSGGGGGSGRGEGRGADGERERRVVQYAGGREGERGGERDRDGGRHGGLSRSRSQSDVGGRVGRFLSSEREV